MLSTLQHSLFCERQTALMQVAQLWEGNVFMAKS